MYINWWKLRVKVPWYQTYGLLVFILPELYSIPLCSYIYTLLRKYSPIYIIWSDKERRGRQGRFLYGASHFSFTSDLQQFTITLLNLWFGYHHSHPCVCFGDRQDLPMNCREKHAVNMGDHLLNRRLIVRLAFSEILINF